MFSEDSRTPQKDRCGRGYTHSELLVALAILAVVFAVFVPMLETKRESTMKINKTREALALLLQISREGMDRSELYPQNSVNYMCSQIKALETTINASDCTMELYNGATIRLTSATDQGAGAWGNEFLIDANGAQPPDTDGDDQLNVAYAFGTASYAVAALSTSIKPGEFGALTAASSTYLQRIYP